MTCFSDGNGWILGWYGAVATIESIGSSTRIEGAKLSDKEVERLLAGLEVKEFASRDEEEVTSYAEAMEIIFAHAQDIPLTENHIKQLHRDLLKYSSKDERHRGEYKTLDNHVEAFGPGGESLGMVFQTATPFDTPRMMTELVEWTRSNLNADELHPLMSIAFFIVMFLEIHPFQDGNGRLSRILTTLLLLRAGYGYVPYSSLESVIEKSKDGTSADAGNDPHANAGLAALADFLSEIATAAKGATREEDRARASHPR